MSGMLYRIPRRWPGLVAAAAAGAVVAGTAAGFGTYYLSDRGTPVAAAPEPALPPDAQPTPKADRQTCQGWDAAGKLINEAAETLTAIPEGTTILAPSVREDPHQTGAVQHAGELFQQASDALGTAITPGATQVLTEMAHSTVNSLDALSTAYKSFDETSADAITVAKTTAHAMSGLCKRLVQ